MTYLEYLKNKLQIFETTEIIDSAIKYLGVEYPPNNPNLKSYEIVDKWIELMVSKWNIEFKILNLTQTKFLGKLEPKNKGFIINLNSNLIPTQKRFVIAHEIAHVLSYNTESKWPVYEVAHSKSEELYCNRIARAILLPKSLIAFGKFDFPNIDRTQTDLIKYLWPEFKVSPWQVLQKILDETNSDSLVGILWKYNQQESCLKILDYYHQQKIFIPRNDRVLLNNSSSNKTNKSPEIAFKSNDIFQDYDLITIGSLYKKKLLSTTFPIKTTGATYVIQIIKTNA